MRTLRQLWVVAVILAGMFAARPVLGPELIPNADFSEGSTSWTAVGGLATFADGEVSFDGPTNGATNLFSSAISAAGKTYQIEIDITESAGTSIFYYYVDGVWIALPNNSVGTHRVVTTYASTVSFGMRAPGPWTGSITRFSVREKLA